MKRETQREGRSRRAVCGRRELIREIEWVRLLRVQESAVGIGFHRKKLVHFSATGAAKGLMHHVSLRESAVILHHLAGVELQVQPDVESAPSAWQRWLGLLVEELA